MDSGNEAYRPAQIADLIETAGVAKAALPLGQMLGCVSRVVEILLSRPPSGLICA